MKGRLAIGILLGLLGLVVALWGVPLAQIGAAFCAAEPLWLLPIAAVFLLQQLLRAARQLLLLAAVRPGISYRNSLAILCISFFCINTLPARLGEIVRPFLLWEREQVPLGAGFGMIFLERMIDFIAVLAMVVLVLLLVPLHSGLLVIGEQQVAVAPAIRQVALTMVPALLVVPVGLILFRRRFLAMLTWLVLRWERWMPLSALRSLPRTALGFSSTFVDALEVLRSPWRLALVLLLTAITWAVSGWMYVWLALALGIGDYVGYGQGVGVMAITMLGTILPSPPGFAGVYEAFARGALAMFGVVGPGLDGPAVTFALIIHWWQFLVQSTTTLYFLWRDGLSFRRLAAIVREGMVRLRAERDGLKPA